MVTIDIKYEGGLHCAATHGPSGDTIATDAPVDNNGKGEAFSPTDLTATSLGACMMTVMGIKAEQKEIDLTGARVQVRKHMSAEPPRRISKLEVDLEMPLAEDHPNRALLEATAMACPVHQSLHPDIEIVMNWSWTG